MERCAARGLAQIELAVQLLLRGKTVGVLLALIQLFIVDGLGVAKRLVALAVFHLVLALGGSGAYGIG